jgi:hypothetical protein
MAALRSGADYYPMRMLMTANGQELSFIKITNRFTMTPGVRVTKNGRI